MATKVEDREVLITGGGAAGLSVAARLRRLTPQLGVSASIPANFRRDDSKVDCHSSGPRRTLAGHHGSRAVFIADRRIHVIASRPG